MQQDNNPRLSAEKRFKCPACGARMTYGLARCDSCGEEAPIYNRRAFMPILYASAGAVLLALAVWLVAG